LVGSRAIGQLDVLAQSPWPIHVKRCHRAIESDLRSIRRKLAEVMDKGAVLSVTTRAYMADSAAQPTLLVVLSA
jgi:hypothetical protein